MRLLTVALIICTKFHVSFHATIKMLDAINKLDKCVFLKRDTKPTKYVLEEWKRAQLEFPLDCDILDAYKNKPQIGWKRNATSKRILKDCLNCFITRFLALKVDVLTINIYINTKTSMCINEPRSYHMHHPLGRLLLRVPNEWKRNKTKQKRATTTRTCLPHLDGQNNRCDIMKSNEF